LDRGGGARAISILEKLINPERSQYHADLGDLYNSEAVVVDKTKTDKSQVDKSQQLEFLRKSLIVRERLVRLRPDDADCPDRLCG